MAFYLAYGSGLRSFLRETFEETQMMVWNEFCDRHGRTDKVYYNDDTFKDKAFADLKPSEIYHLYAHDTDLDYECDDDFAFYEDGRLRSECSLDYIINYDLMVKDTDLMKKHFTPEELTGYFIDCCDEEVRTPLMEALKSHDLFTEDWETVYDSFLGRNEEETEGV